MNALQKGVPLPLSTWLRLFALGQLLGKWPHALTEGCAGRWAGVGVTRSLSDYSARLSDDHRESSASKDINKKPVVLEHGVIQNDIVEKVDT